MEIKGSLLLFTTACYWSQSSAKCIQSMPSHTLGSILTYPSIYIQVFQDNLSCGSNVIRDMHDDALSINLIIKL
jgi:hypothetical protein